MSEDLVKQLSSYKAQLQQVEVALSTDPDNEDLLKLQKDLQVCFLPSSENGFHCSIYKRFLVGIERIIMFVVLSGSIQPNDNVPFLFPFVLYFLFSTKNASLNCNIFHPSFAFCFFFFTTMLFADYLYIAGPLYRRYILPYVYNMRLKTSEN